MMEILPQRRAASQRNNDKLFFCNFIDMIRTTIKPTNTDVHISIPDDYVGKNLEVLLYATDEPLDIVSQEVNTMAKYKGIFSSKEADELQEYVRKSHEEWEKDI